MAPRVFGAQPACGGGRGRRQLGGVPRRARSGARFHLVTRGAGRGRRGALCSSRLAQTHPMRDMFVKLLSSCSMSSLTSSSFKRKADGDNAVSTRNKGSNSLKGLLFVLVLASAIEIGIEPGIVTCSSSTSAFIGWASHPLDKGDDPVYACG